MKKLLSLLTIVTILCNISSANDLKNVLLLIFDDLRPALRCYGDANAVTPNIDRIASDGIAFKHVYAQQALCAPSRNSMLTSRRPDTLHLYNFDSYWRSDAGNFTTLPQYFKDNGYHTKSIGKVFHPGVSSNFSDDQPYSWSETPFHPDTLVYKNAEVCYSDEEPFVPHKNVVCPVRLSSQPGGTLPDIESTQEAVEFLRRSKTIRQPFFLAVGYHKPHLPLKYPKHFDDYHDLHQVVLPIHRTRPPRMPDIAWNPWTDLRERFDVQKLNLTFPYQPMPDKTAKLIRRSYYASVTYVDSLLGEIIDQLMELSLYEETIIVLLGDHGWALGENGEWSKYNNYESTTRVPLIIRAPRVISNVVHSESNEDFAELLDVFPTLAHLAGLPDVPKCSDKSKDTMLCTEGKNLFQKHKRQSAYSQYPRPSEQPRTDSDKPKLKNIRYMGYTIRNKHYRYTEYVRFQNFTPNWSEIVAMELFDHRKDAEEFRNVANLAEYSSIRDCLSKELHEQGKH